MHRRYALIMSLAAGGVFILSPPILGVFALGILTSVAYPVYKVPIEGHALSVIQHASSSHAQQVSLTSVKELWLNSGRMISFFFLLGLFFIIPRAPAAMRLALALWPLTTVLVHVTSRQFSAASLEVARSGTDN